MAERKLHSPRSCFGVELLLSGKRLVQTTLDQFEEFKEIVRIEMENQRRFKEFLESLK